MAEGKIIDRYEIESVGVKTRVNIVDEDHTLYYKLVLPEVDVATSALLDDIKERLISSADIKTSEVLDSKTITDLKKAFEENAGTILGTELPDLEDNVKNHFILSMVHELLGLEDIDFFLDDDKIEEIVINSAKEPVRVYHKKHHWLATNVTPKSEMQIQNYSNTIARRIGREITTLNPLLDAHLMTKDRANAILMPISTKGNTITIRKFARDPWTVTDFIKNKTANSEVMALIWLVMQYEMNMLLSGGTGSGKTSFLNICMPFVLPNQRIISIEDTRELQLPQYLYWTPLTTRQPNPEGKGEVSMLDLLVNSLRMRPDRIIMGEVRKKREAEVLFEAMHTGHSVYATLHADTCEQTIARLTNPPVDIPHSMLDSVHLNVVMFRDRRRGIRRTFEVGEFVPDETAAKRGDFKFRPNVIYKWNARSDTVALTKVNAQLYERIGVHTGFTEQEVLDEIQQKKKILESLVEHNIRSIDDVGRVMNRYYVDTDYVVDLFNKGKDPKKLLEI